MSDTDDKPEVETRRVLHSAYAFIRSVKLGEVVGAKTFDHMIAERIQSLKGSPMDIGGSVRMSRWDRIDALEKMLEAVVTSVSERS
jgi:hypothetical protein